MAGPCVLRPVNKDVDIACVYAPVALSMCKRGQRHVLKLIKTTSILWALNKLARKGVITRPKPKYCITGSLDSATQLTQVMMTPEGAHRESY